MILLSNNQTHYQSKSALQKSTLAWDEYPEQDMSFVGKRIHLAYRDMNSHDFFNRLSINKKLHPEFSIERREESDDNWWRILRFDKPTVTNEDDISVTAFSKIAILIDNHSRVIVAPISWFNELRYPPLADWSIAGDEALLKFADTWMQFNYLYDREPIFSYKAQNTKMIGKIVYTEYWKDLTRYRYDDPIRIVTADPNQFDKPWEEIKEQILEGNPDLDILPDCVLRGFPHYYNKRKKEFGDFPRRPINTGVIIKYDESNIGPGEGKIVVAEYTPTGLRFVTDKEAFIYYETDTDKTDISKLDLFNFTKENT